MLILIQTGNIKSLALAAMLLATVTGCETRRSDVAPPEPLKHIETIQLREGDVLKIGFPGAPTLNTTQQVRRDGNITIPLLGELKVVGLTPTNLEQSLLKLYDAQLVTKEVSVSVESSAFPVFVTGAAIRPGKIMSDRPITVIEAIMEAGGFDYSKANLKKITVIRNQTNSIGQFIVNLKDVLNGKPSEPFYLKPSDIIYIPEKFSWF
jgi:polysaccharide biosynthesis/export protein